MDRREFLVGALGTGLISAIALKDASGVSLDALTGYEWIELPSGDAEVYNTTCQYCHVQCGYKVYVWEKGKGKTVSGSYTAPLSGEWISPSFIIPARKNGKDVYCAVVPDRDCAVNSGDHSVRGGTSALTLYRPDSPVEAKRLRYPMIRRNGKGSPLEKVKWEEAIEFAAKRLMGFKEKYGPDSLCVVWGDWLYAMPTYAILKLWFEGLRSSSYAGNGWFWDEESAGISAALGDGTRSFTIEDFEITSLLVTAGKNLESTGSVWYHRFFKQIGKAKHIDIDPRRTHQARLAEEHGGLHLQIRPGTDAILACGLMQIIIKRDAYDKEFVKKYVSGFEALRETVMLPRFSLENVVKVTGISREKILKAADLLIENKGRTMILGEKGIMHQMAAFEAQHAYACLGIILGNVGKPGACVSRGAGHPKGTFAWPKEPPSRENNKYFYRALEEGKIKSIWAFGSNILRQLPCLTKYAPLMAKTFVIVQDRIHTEMDDIADVIFPAATWGEMEGVFASEDRRVRILQKFMDPPGEARPDWQIVSQMAKAMGIKGFDWSSPREIWDEIRQRNDWVKEITWDALLKAGTNGVRYPMINGRSPERLYSDEMEQIMGKRFFTKDNKIHVEKISVLKDFDPKKYEWGEISERYPLMAIDFRLNELWNTGYTYWDKPAVYQRHPEPFVMINPEDAKVRGIEDGDWTVIESPYGRCKAQAKVTKDVKKTIVAVPALFPKSGREYNSNYITRPHPSPVNGDVDTMVAVEVYKA